MSDLSSLPRRLPPPGASHRRSPARLPRLSGNQPEAGARHRGDLGVLPDDQRQRAPWGVSALGRGNQCVRGGAEQGRNVRGGRESVRSGLHSRDDGRDQPHRVRMGPQPASQRRPHRAHRDGAPLEHRAVADSRTTHRGRAGLPSPERRLSGGPEQPRRGPRRPDQDRRRHGDVERHRCGSAAARHRVGRASGWCDRRRRWRPIRAAHAGRRQHHGSRLPRLQRPQDARPHRNRRTVGAA